MGRDEALPQKEALLRDIREARMAPAWRSFATQFIGLRPDHLTVSVTDRKVFVQRVDDWSARQCLARREKDVDAKEESVLEMDHVRLVGVEELAKSLQIE